MEHTGRELFRSLVDGIVREALGETHSATPRPGAGSGDAVPTNGYWDDSGQWCPYFLLGVTGLEEAGMA